MDAFWAAVIGAIVGGLLTGLTAFCAFKWQRRAQLTDANNTLRREVTSGLVTSLSQFRETRANPSVERSREVSSRLDADEALFRGILTPKEQQGIGEYVFRIRRHMHAGTNGWTDENNFVDAVGSPLLRWAVHDSSYSDEWLKKRCRALRKCSCLLITAQQPEASNLDERLRCGSHVMPAKRSRGESG